MKVPLKEISAHRLKRKGCRVNRMELQRLEPVQTRITTADAETRSVSDLTTAEGLEAVEVGEAAVQKRQPEQVKAEEAVRVLRDTESGKSVGGIISIGVLAIPLLVIALSSCLMEGSLGWAAACLVGLTGYLALMRQANLLDIEHVALQNSHRDPHWMAALTEVLDWPDPRLGHIAGRLLTQFLPRLRDSDACLFDRKRLHCLYRRLSPHSARRNSELALAILQALPHIGTDRAIPYVARLASRNAFTPAGRRIREAAAAVLPLLEQRSADRRAAEMAARADTAVTTGVEKECSQTEAAELAEINARVDTQIKAFEADLRRMRAPTMRLGFLLASWGILVPGNAFLGFQSFLAGNWPMGLLFMMLAALCTQLHRLTLTNEHKRLAEKMGRMDDVRCIGRLAELLDWPDDDVRAIAIMALQRLLPRAKASDRALGTPAQRAILYRMLNPSNSEHYTEFQAILLKALEQIGDGAAVPYVEALANGHPSSAREQRIFDVANDCLPYLLACSERARSSETLLRASSATAAGAEELMRPASGREVEHQEELLRASAGEDGDQT